MTNSVERADLSSPLDDIQIASPCHEPWQNMTKLGTDGRVRFCGRCSQNVYNLIGMSREEAEKLLRERGAVCVRLFKREDGTTITKDCGREARGKIKLRKPPLEPPKVDPRLGAPSRRTYEAFPRFMGRVDLVPKPPTTHEAPEPRAEEPEKKRRSRFPPDFEKGRRRERWEDERP